VVSDSFQAGCLVVNPAKPEWGPGRVVKMAPGKAHVVWRDLETNEAKVMLPGLLHLAPDQQDEILDNLPPLIEKGRQAPFAKGKNNFRPRCI